MAQRLTREYKAQMVELECEAQRHRMIAGALQTRCIDMMIELELSIAEEKALQDEIDKLAKTRR